MAAAGGGWRIMWGCIYEVNFNTCSLPRFCTPVASGRNRDSLSYIYIYTYKYIYIYIYMYI